MTLYRATVNDYGQDGFPELELYFQSFDVIRETDRFYVILRGNKERRVSKTAKAAFAATSKEKAVRDAYRRNYRHIQILNDRLEYAREVLGFLKDHLN